MARIGRAGVAQAFNSQGPIFGPRDAIIPPPIPPFAPISVNLAVGLTTNQRRTQKRFPLQGWEDGQTTITKVVQNTITDGTGYQLVTSGSFYAQSFIAHDTTLVGVKTQISKFGSPVDQITVSIRNDSADSPGTVITTTTFNPSSATGLAGLFDIPNLQTTLTPGTKYWLTFARTGATDAVNNYFIWAYTASGVAGARGPFPEGSYFQTGIGVISHVDLVFSLYFADNQPGMFQRLLGPKPPTVIQVAPNAEPVRVCSQAIARRVAEKKRFPLQGFANDTPLLGVRPPTVVSQTPLAPPISVNLSAGLTTNQRRAQKRYPLQGWDAFETRTSRTNNKLAGTFSQISGGSGTTEAIAEAFPGSAANISIQFTATRFNSPTDNLVVSIQEDSGGQPSGVALWTTSIPCTSLPATPATNQYAFTPGISLADKPMYWVVYERDGVRDTTNRPAILAALGTQTLATLLTIGKARNSGVWVLGGGSATFLSLIGDETQGVFQRLLGPRPPLTLLTSFVAPPPVEVNRASRLPVEMQEKRFPLQGWEGETTFYTDTSTFGGTPSRNLGPRPPVVIDPAAVVVAYIDDTIGVALVAVAMAVAGQQRQPHSKLLTVQYLAQPPPVETTVRVHLVAARPRRTHSLLAPPSVLQTFATSKPTLVQTRPRHVIHQLNPPTVVRVPSVEQRQQTITVSLARIRPRPTHSRVSAPVALRVFDGPRVTTVRTRPRPTVHTLRAPTVVRVPSVEQQQQTIRVVNVRTRPRATQALLSPPTVLQTFAGPLVRVVKTRPQPTVALLAPPTVLQTFAAAVEERLVVQLAPERPRYAPHSKLSPPTVLRTFAGPSVHLVTARPRPTRHTLFPPTVVAQAAVVTYKTAVTVVRTRPRPTVAAVQPPTVVAVAQVYYGPRVVLVRSRPRPTTTLLSPPTVLDTYQSGKPAVVRTRPRQTTHRLSPPTVVRVPSVEQQQQTIRVSLTRTRPPTTHARVSAPTVLQTFSGPDVTLARIRPPRTHAVIEPPTVLQVFDGPTVALATIRPPQTRSKLSEPIFYAQTSTIVTRLVAVASRRTSEQQRAPHSRLFPPTVLQTFAGPVEEQVTVRTLLERPRHAPHYFLRPPTIVRVPSVEQQQRTITTRLVTTRPRPTTRTLRPPTVVSRPPVGEIVTALDAVRTRVEQPRRFPLQGSRHRIVRETGSAAGINMSLRDPFLGPRPPQIIDPLPSQQQQTIRVVLDSVRTRVEQKRHYPLPGFRQRLVRETGSTVTCQMRDPLLGPRPPVVIDPLPTQREQTIKATLVAVRTRYEQKRHAPHSQLDPPTVVDRTTFEGADVTTVKTRPRPTVHAVFPPTVVRVPAVEQALRTIRVDLVRTRPRPTVHVIEPPTVLATFAGPSVHLVTTRPRPTHVALRPPRALRTFAGPQVHLVKTRPRPTVALLSPPAVVGRFVAEPVSVTLARTRPRPTTTTLSPPTALRTFAAGKPHLARTRPRPTQATLGTPVVSVPAVEQALRSIRVHLARIRPSATTSELRRPIAAATFAGPTVHTVRTRPRHVTSTLRPPVVVAAQALTYSQTTISVTLAPSPDLVRGTTTRLPGPPLVIKPRMGFTTGEDVPASAVEGFGAGGSFVDSETAPASAVESDQIAGVDSVIEDVPATAVEGGPEEAFD